ncbi:hypothetical protein QQX98_008071 [Neonectria punicea]|uniref:Zn(2)-C6 fungal-type domain-containing protein n=1 Tax=Neonectria punicea TaxID=979145 RepID=A0ABR1GW92_9HYPO
MSSSSKTRFENSSEENLDVEYALLHALGNLDQEDDQPLGEPAQYQPQPDEDLWGQELPGFWGDLQGPESFSNSVSEKGTNSPTLDNTGLGQAESQSQSQPQPQPLLPQEQKSLPQGQLSLPQGQFYWPQCQLPIFRDNLIFPQDQLVLSQDQLLPPQDQPILQQDELQLPQPQSKTGDFLTLVSPYLSPPFSPTKRKEAPGPDAAERSPTPKRRCIPKSCLRCKTRKAKCLRDGDEDCKSCLKAGQPCVRENVDLREKTAVLASLQTKEVAYHKAYTAAARLVSKAMETVLSVDSGPSVLDGAVVSLTEKRNDKAGSLMENLPTIAHCLACPEVTIDSQHIAPIPAVDVAALTKPQLKKHVDSFDAAAGARIHGFRKAVIALMTAYDSWPVDLLRSRNDLCVCALQGVHEGSFDAMVDWGTTSEYAQKLFEENQAKNN